MKLNTLLNALLGSKKTQMTLTVTKSAKGLSAMLTGAGANLTVDEAEILVDVAGAEVKVGEGTYLVGYADGTVGKFEPKPVKAAKTTAVEKAEKPAPRRSSGSAHNPAYTAAY